MTARFRKKNRRMRGRTTHGYGSKKKHRGGGSRGGRGFAGLHKHKYSLILSTEGVEYFRRKGFHSRKKKVRAINVGDIEKVSGGKHEINLASMGFSKLLSRGNVSRPLNVRVSKYTERAKSKIEKAGGTINK